MKKIIALAVVIVTFCLENVSAQKKDEVSPQAAGLKREFKDASDVHWTKLKNNIFLATFENLQEHSIAYFDGAGQLILSGRKIPFEQMPRLAKKGTEGIRTKLENKNDIVTVGEVYELAGSDGTQYYLNMYGEATSLSMIVSGDGSTRILKKVSKPESIVQRPVVAAKDN